MQGHDLYIFNKITGSFLEFVGMLGSKDFNRIRNCRGMIYILNKTRGSFSEFVGMFQSENFKESNNTLCIFSLGLRCKYVNNIVQ